MCHSSSSTVLKAKTHSHCKDDIFVDSCTHNSGPWPTKCACMHTTGNIFQMSTYPHPNLTQVRPIALDPQSAGVESVTIYLGVSQRLEYLGGWKDKLSMNQVAVNPFS